MRAAGGRHGRVVGGDRSRRRRSRRRITFGLSLINNNLVLDVVQVLIWGERLQLEVPQTPARAMNGQVEQVLEYVSTDQQHGLPVCDIDTVEDRQVRLGKVADEGYERSVCVVVVAS